LYDYVGGGLLPPVDGVGAGGGVDDEVVATAVKGILCKLDDFVLINL